MKLKTNTSLIIIITAAILLQGLSAVQYYYTRSLLADELEKRAESELSIKAIIIKNSLSLSENSLMGHVWDLKRNLFHPDSSYTVVEWVLKYHPYLTGSWVAYVPDYFPEKGRLYEPYAWWNHEEIKSVDLAAKGHDYTQNPYYKAVYASDTPMWTDVYHESVSDMNLVTYVHPIHGDKGDIVAMFGLDVSTDQLGDTLNYRHIYPSSYNFLLTEKGQLIAGPQHTSEKKAREMQHIIDMINDSTVEKSLSTSGRSFVLPIKNDDGDKGMVFYANMKGDPKWKIAVVCYDKEVYAKLVKMRVTIGILMLLGLLALGLIIARFTKNDRKLQKANLEQARIGSELRIAMRIQQEMLPHSFSLGRDDIDIFGSLTPAREVGGDLFDFFIRDEKLFFCIGDVSGKGVPSAIVMAVIHSMFRMASVHENDPSRIMQTINETACEGNESNMFVTLFVGVLDLPTGHLCYCNAGHDAPYIIDHRQLSVVDCDANLPIGVFSDVKFSLQETQLPSGSTIFLYTDGLTEAKKARKQFFGEKRTEAVLTECAAAQLTPRQMLESVTEAVHQYVGDAEQSDDLTMLAIRYTPQANRLFITNDVHEVPKLNDFQKSFYAKLNLEKSLARRLQLAVEEAVVNVIEYAYPIGTEGPIEIRMISDAHRLKVMILDSGIAFDPTLKERADITPSVEDRQIGGLGIHLYRELMDSIHYERKDGKNILTLIKTINT